jgi:AraC-like DNA-binding protein
MRISRIEAAPSLPGIERMSAFFRGHAFSPHRHDTYAIGITAIGVQSFGYRGAERHSLPGQVIVLHPDERHDGHAGDDRGFGYRIAYVDPALIRDAGEAKVLPFLRDPVSRDRKLLRAVSALVAVDGEPADELATTCTLVGLVDALATAAKLPVRVQGPASDAVKRVRDLLQATLDARVPVAELEVLSGLSRWQLTRQFSNAFGVSPARYHLMRRLDRARVLLGSGNSLAEAAQSTGFADQAHLTRHFRSTYGLSPGQWQQLRRERRG